MKNFRVSGLACRLSQWPNGTRHSRELIGKWICFSCLFSLNTCLRSFQSVQVIFFEFNSISWERCLLLSKDFILPRKHKQKSSALKFRQTDGWNLHLSCVVFPTWKVTYRSPWNTLTTGQSWPSGFAKAILLSFAVIHPPHGHPALMASGPGFRRSATLQLDSWVQGQDDLDFNWPSSLDKLRDAPQEMPAAIFGQNKPKDTDVSALIGWLKSQYGLHAFRMPEDCTCALYLTWTEHFRYKCELKAFVIADVFDGHTSRLPTAQKRNPRCRLWVQTGWGWDLHSEWRRFGPHWQTIKHREYSSIYCCLRQMHRIQSQFATQ